MDAANGDSGGRVRRRAVLVCNRCHNKKIRCDLSTQSDNQACSNCHNSRSDCSVRIAGPRGNRRRRLANKSSTGQRPNEQETLFVTPNDQPPRLPPVIGLENRFTTFNQQQGSSHLNNHSLSRNVAEDDLACPSTTPQSLTTTLKEQSYLGRSGLMPLISSEPGGPARPSPLGNVSRLDHSEIAISPMLLKSFVETYLEFCYPFCPVLERENLFRLPTYYTSPILQQALALLGTRVNPPIIQHEDPQKYYERTKALFYGNHESNTLIRIMSIILLYWWSAGPPNVTNMESQFWWTSIAIRLGQEIGLYREVTNYHSLEAGETPELRRRVWWTLYVSVYRKIQRQPLTVGDHQARERLTSICHGRPCIINPEDCDIQAPSTTDFPIGHEKQALIFIHWVKICDIIGQIAAYLARRTDDTSFSLHLAEKLVEWVHSLPEELRLPFGTSWTQQFDLQIHQLHLPYLSAITLLYMNTTVQPLPKAYTAAILASSCVSRIFYDYLTHGNLKFLPGMAGWYISIAALALLHARQNEDLREAANEELEVLFLALKEMAKLWHSSKMFLVGFERLIEKLPQTPHSRSIHVVEPPDTRTTSLTDSAPDEGVGCLDFFPGTSRDTSKIFEVLLTDNPPVTIEETLWMSDLSNQLYDLFDQPGDGSDFDILLS